MSNEFIGGLKISENFFHEEAKPLLVKSYPNLKYSAALIGPGSEVLGLDTEISTDHDWRPRFFIFLNDQDFQSFGKEVERTLKKELPRTFQGYKTRPEKAGDLRSKFVYSPKVFLKKYLGLNSIDAISDLDWLTFDEHKLLGITSGKVFKNNSGDLGIIREKLAYYPSDIWLYAMASEWMKIAEEEAFVGRTGEVQDELGSRVISTRIIQSLMRLCFLTEKTYAPYSKWFGTGFKKLTSAPRLLSHLENALNAADWKSREQALSAAYEAVVELHNTLQITSSFPTKVRQYHDRPYMVIGAGDIASAIQKSIKDEKLRTLPLIGSVNQFTDSVALIENDSLRSKLKRLFR